jgi:hypothetical protein
MASRKGANPRFRIAAIYPSVNIQPLIKNIKIDTQHSFFIVRLNNPSRVEEEIALCVGILLTGLTRPMFLSVPGGSSWSWSFSSWINDYLCNQCLSPLTLWVRIPFRRAVLDTTLCDKVCQWLAAGWWFFPLPIKLTATIQLKFFESGIKIHNPNHVCP